MNSLQAEYVVMIGDSWNSDIQGAINAGIDQIWIRKIGRASCRERVSVRV